MTLRQKTNFLVGISLIKVTIFGKSLGQLDFFSSLSSPTSWGNKANSDFHPRSISFVYMITFWLNIFSWIYTPFLKVKKKPIGTWNSYFWQHNILLLRTLISSLHTRQIIAHLYKENWNFFLRWKSTTANLVFAG